jgi:hypothetical protein
MNLRLTRLGVPASLQAWVNVTSRATFDYGGSLEVFGDNFHKVPTTANLWLGGSRAAAHVIITHSAIEALALLSRNLNHFPDLDRLCVIALGNLPSSGQLQWIRQYLKNRRFVLGFGNDLLASLMDIKVAAGLKGKETKIWLSGTNVTIQCRNQSCRFEAASLSLNVFEKAFGLRTGIRTRKPGRHATYFDHLTNNAETDEILTS